MIEVRVQLYSILREKLPAEARGRAVLRFEERATLADVLRELDIGRRVVISVNGEYEADRSRPLRDQDDVKIFSSVSGGSPAEGGCHLFAALRLAEWKACPAAGSELAWHIADGQQVMA